MSPFCTSGLIFFSGRLFTIPLAETTYSARTSLATAIAISSFGKTTPCTMPERSRRSKNTIFPWSRRTDTHPETLTCSPIFLFRSAINVLGISQCCSNFLSDFSHFRRGDGAGFVGAVLQNIFNFLVADVCAPLAHRGNKLFNILDQRFFKCFVVALVGVV